MTSSDTHLDWQPALGADGIVGGLDDIDQCVQIILGGGNGSVPHRPDFPVNLEQYIDWPQGQAVAFIVRDARAGLLKYEPRIKDVKFTVLHTIGAIELTTEWLPNAGGGWQKSVVTVTKSA